jgi:hypothetical protein
MTKQNQFIFFIINSCKTRKVDKKKKFFKTILGDWNIEEYDPNGAFIPNTKRKSALPSTSMWSTDF